LRSRAAYYLSKIGRMLRTTRLALAPRRAVGLTKLHLIADHVEPQQAANLCTFNECRFNFVHRRCSCRNANVKFSVAAPPQPLCPDEPGNISLRAIHLRESRHLRLLSIPGGAPTLVLPNGKAACHSTFCRE